MQCLAVARLPEGPDWEYEIKFDGNRALGIKSGGRVRLVSRNGNDFSGRFPSVANALSKLPDDSIVDGEIVALDETGRPSFNVLQNYHHSATLLQFYIFDLLNMGAVSSASALAILSRRLLISSSGMCSMKSAATSLLTISGHLDDSNYTSPS
jgi:ATP-dependent DNA ligase